MDDLIKKYLYDILEAIAFIKEALEEIEGFSYYQSHKLFKPSIERKLGIIGEAVNKANQIDPDLPISNKFRIISMRNRLIHSYDAVDDVLVWEVITKHLPVLEVEVKELMKK
jgi:uncharacterized protein with HEPN domain